MRNHPDFLVIGPTRAGTTWINWALSQHPESWVPLFKELHYFNVQKHKLFNKFYLRHREQLWRKISKIRRRKQVPSREEVFWWMKYFLLPRNDRWYQGLFPALSSQIKSRGECTPKYCLLPDEEISNIVSINPEIKVIFVLRNPLDRAWSILARRHGRKQGRTLDSYEEVELEYFFQNIGEEHKSLNKNCIERWRRHVPEERFLVCWFDDLQRDPQDFLNKLSDFIGIDSSLFQSIPNLETKRNSTSEHRPTTVFPIVNKQMAEWYMDDIAYVAENFGGHGKVWHEQANFLLTRDG